MYCSNKHPSKQRLTDLPALLAAAGGQLASGINHRLPEDDQVFSDTQNFWSCAVEASFANTHFLKYTTMKSDMKGEEKQVLPDGRSRKSNGLMDDHVMENQTTPLKVIVLCTTGMNSTIECESPLQ